MSAGLDRTNRLTLIRYTPLCHRRQPASMRAQMLATLAADPVASLVDTGFVGHLGAAQLAGVGVAMSVFQSVTRVRAEI